MPVITPQKLIDLQRLPDNIRNICILAHVDHGKTSLTDALLATNGIISPKLAGKIRYLDSRPDEQLRGITMEASAISLFFSMLRRAAADDTPQVHEYLINLIDSPGHVDFQSEVSTASRLCDGAVVLVDAVEGVCSQTVAVLRQTWVEKLKPILVINKMDRLVTELKLSPAEAYVHLAQLLEMVNVVMGTFFQGERMEDDMRWRERMEERVQAAKSQARDDPEVAERDYEEKDDEDIYFAPEKNNVVFSSAIDGWAFTVKQFAGIYDKKLGIKREILEKVLWGDFYLDPKTKRVLGSKHLKGRPLKPMFVQLVLENIWAVYTATGGQKGRGDEALLTKITSSLNITIPPHVLKSRDPTNILTTLFSKWLPLSTALLVSVIEQLPSPRAAQESRMPALLESTPGYPDIDPNIKHAICNFTQDKDSPLVAFVSKMIAVKESELPRNKRHSGQTLTAEEARELARKRRAEIVAAQESDQSQVSTLSSAMSSVNISDTKADDDPEHFIGFARIYSGTLSVGSKIYVIPPKYSASDPHNLPPIQVKVEALYLLMGKALESLESVPAGTIFGIEGLESALLKQGTLSSAALGAPNLAGIGDAKIEPIVRVSLEPENPSDLDKMINGLKMLERSDPCATYEVLESGEHVLGTAGELHLERCLKDLRERFARCEIQAGRPIVPYREGIVNHPSVSGAMEVGPRGTVTVDVLKGAIKATLRVRPLPRCVIDYLTGNSAALKKAVAERENHHDGHYEQAIGEKETGRAMSTAEFAAGLREAFAASKEKEGWAGVVDRIVAFGPRRVGPNLLVDATGKLGKPFFPGAHANGDFPPARFADRIIYAFQLAVAQGPLCHEPVQGIAVTLEALATPPPTPSPSSTTAAAAAAAADGDPTADQQSRLTSEALKATRLAVHRGLLEWSPRLWEAVYACSITASPDALGRVYAVLTRRRAAIRSEDLAEGVASASYLVESLLPLREALGFADELRKNTSGAAAASLAFRGFEIMVDEDPFWVPATEEEREDLGDTADRENRAKGLVDGIRERKGLLVLGKGLDPEKQRTMKR
jgi:ribosome assembly protein 1